MKKIFNKFFARSTTKRVFFKDLSVQASCAVIRTRFGPKSSAGLLVYKMRSILNLHHSMLYFACEGGYEKTNDRLLNNKLLKTKMTIQNKEFVILILVAQC